MPDRLTNAEFIAAVKPVCEAATGKMYPVQDGPDIPWVIAEQHEHQFERNHYQTMQRLSERGGLGVNEMLHVLHDQTWNSEFTAMLTAKTKSECSEMLQQFVAEHFYLVQLEQLRATLPEALERLDAAVADNERWAALAGDGLHGQRDLHARLLKAEAKRDELQKLRQIAQNWQENERAIVERGPSEGRGRWKMETELALSLALDRLAAQEEKP